MGEDAGWGPAGVGERPSAGVLAAMVARELESLATVRSDADGRRLRILMRMADRSVAAT